MWFLIGLILLLNIFIFRDFNCIYFVLKGWGNVNTKAVNGSFILFVLVLFLSDRIMNKPSDVNENVKRGAFQCLSLHLFVSSFSLWPSWAALITLVRFWVVFYLWWLMLRSLSFYARWSFHLSKCEVFLAVIDKMMFWEIM